MQISQAAICSTTLGYPALSVNPVLEGPPHTLLRDIVYAPRRVLLRGRSRRASSHGNPLFHDTCFAGRPLVPGHFREGTGGAGVRRPTTRTTDYSPKSTRPALRIRCGALRDLRQKVVPVPARTGRILRRQ